MLGTTENELGIRKWIEEQGHELVTTSDKEGEGSEFDKHLVDAEVIITTPFHPGYLTAERLAKAKNLKIAVTAVSDPITLISMRRIRPTAASRSRKSRAQTSCPSPSTLS